MSSVKFINDNILASLGNHIRFRLHDNSWRGRPSEFPNAIKRIDIGYIMPEGYVGLLVNSGLVMTNKFQNNQFLLCPWIGYDVTACDRAFNNCRNALGKPVMWGSVSSMTDIYRNCINLTGEIEMLYSDYYPTTMIMSFTDCINITGNAPNCPGVVNLDRTYLNCQSLNGHCGTYPNATYMYQTYANCYNLTGNPYVGPSVTNMKETFANCYNIVGDSMVSDAATDMSWAYYGCNNLTGNAFSGNAATNMLNAYRGCTNMKGRAFIGPNVTIATGAFANCENLGGTPLIGDKVTNAMETFMGCKNLRGSVIYPNSCIGIERGCMDCESLSGVYIGFNGNAATYSAAKMSNAFYRTNHQNRLDIVCRLAGVFTNVRTGVATNCTMTAVETVTAENAFIVNLPYTYSNGQIYGYETHRCLKRSYNEEFNVYAYSEQ